MTSGYTRKYDWDEPDDEATVFVAQSFLVRPTDPHKNPLPHGKCRLVADKDRVFECDDDGVAKIPLRDSNQESVELEWEPQEAEGNDAGHRFYWHGTFKTGISSADDAPCAQRLAHLGFRGNTLEEQVKAYQLHFNQEPTGRLADIRTELTNWHDGGTYPGSER